MKIRAYDGSNKLTRSNIISVAKAFYDGLSYEKTYAPAGWDFEPGARLIDLKTGIKKEDDFFDMEEEFTQFDRWKEKNLAIYQEAGKQMKELNLVFLDVVFLPTTHKGSAKYFDCCTHWKPTICANREDENYWLYVFEEETNKWYQLYVTPEEYDVPCGSDYGTALGMGAFVRFLSALIK